MTENHEEVFLENRKNERYEINKPVLLHIDKSTYSVQMKNISISGFGIYIEGNKSFGSILSEETIINIEWQKDAFLSAKVVWVSKNRAGIMLEQAISHNHPLFLESSYPS